MHFRKFILLFICCTFTIITYSQSDTAHIELLQEINIKAYEHNHQLKDIPAAINYIGPSTLFRINPTSIVTAVNSTPGVHMEERSPGSFRFNIRGSSLRAPFGVRNVKIYFNDIPVTDPGGQSYLNELGYYNFNSIEIIKGPGSSLYGAGTGGVLLIESVNEKDPKRIFSEYSTGSYNVHNIYASVKAGDEKSANTIGFQHQQSDGYRFHSKLRRDVFAWYGNYSFNEKQHLKTTFLYGDLFYETPGALTKSEYDANSRAARPPVGSTPGAESANASINQKQFIAGASYSQQFSSKFQNKTVLYGMFTELRNPAIQNYGRNSEPHFGTRTVFKFNQPFSKTLLNIDVGAELQQGFATLSVYKNVGGIADSLRTFDEVNNRQSLVFTQISVDNKSWNVTAGGSLNFLHLKFQRFTPASLGKQSRKFNNQFAPRIAVLKKFNGFNIYASIAKGFSPPTTAELLPTGSAANLDLEAEQGTNYDLGIKATLWKRLYIDVNGFIYSLQNAIVQRRNAAGGDFYINAGKTKQHGIETYMSYPLFSSSMKRSIVWLSHTWHDFHYKDFKQLTNDFSGKQLPGTPQHIISSGFDCALKNGLEGTLTYYYSDRIPLNDANSEYASPYHLLGVKVGYEKIFRKMNMKIFTGIDNILNQKYSLGNDINGFGGRYYNAAPRRNYFGGVALSIL